MLKSVVSLSVALALSACSPQNTQPENQAPTAVSQQQELKSGVNKENMDLTVDPGNDFFQYVNGTWVDNLEIPADKSSYGAFTILRDESQDHVMKIIKSSAEGDFADGTDEQKVGDFYRAYMDTDKLNELGISPINADIEKIQAITNYDELAAYFAYAIRYGYASPFNVGQNADFKSPESYMIYTWQSGLGLPERDYYFKDDTKSQEIRDAYVKHIETMFTLAEFDAPSDNAQLLFDMESRIAELHMKKEEVRNWAANYNKVPVSELSTHMPNFPWELFLKEMELDDLDSIVFLQTDFMKQMDTFITETSLEDWKVFLKWGLLNASASRLSEDFDTANFNFYSKTLRGVEEPEPRWRRAVSLSNAHVGEVIGKVYVKQYFPPEAKERMTEMVSNLLLAYKDSIEKLDWMTDETREQALDKLSKFTVKIGYPDTWKDYSQLVVKGSDLFGNLKRSSDVAYEEMLKKQGGPVWKHEWGMTPQTVNAYYNPTANEIVFPAAILQPPFFDMNAEDAVNYGGIGAVIGHEIGHGFDDAGSTFDGDGALRNWWTDTDRQEFEARTAKLVEQFNEFEALPELFVNGEYTLGENIGDLGGISIALKAYHLTLEGEEAPVIDGYTGDQRVFIGYGQVWASKYRDEALRSQIQTDTHSPTKFRTNGALRNVPEFYEAFDVTEENDLYLPPEERVKIW
ncbi:M13-type metalloendopeptidase [Alteromonas stellipolaris]|uniref:M13-type metalloendopeptidase n=1 Tax=Alteromonas stellipolaris TaxID=233316 RepID=A0AAW7Z1V4_9ALTE|nr:MULTISPECIES: M13-type metalloendopeptidase [Alteromonas]MDO6533791.1 M13-type metalloendopeptidase [Alteromonas stellipolaris]MDO6540784.1 M13-type metalloendopeptidase [Alteromonas stellipolaris]MDO6577020.1 M13-type metalloendopeptidase [Alteromonas stellipolaris]MDO6625215.1 M13-type metalloendopeptidase [Alteromonas stellipolaris]